MRIVFAGGGTGGHLYPALAACREIKALDPGISIDWVGSKGRIEERVVPAAGIPFRGFELSGIDRSGRGLGALVGLVRASARLILATATLVADFLANPPGAVVVSGAYISVPSALAAILTRVPLFILEQNSIPGMANRLLSPFARSVFASFPSSVEKFPSAARVVVTGNPLREGIIEVRKGRLCDRPRLDAMRTEAMSKFSLDPSRRLLTVMGGSLGSGSLTRAFLDALAGLSSLDRIAGDWQFLVITGGREGAATMPLSGLKLSCIEYVDDMDLLYAATDAMVVRAGASTVTEILALGMPAAIVPWSGSAEGHQALNASLPGSLGCDVVDETGLDAAGLPRALAPVLEKILTASGVRESVLAIASGGMPAAGPAIARAILGRRRVSDFTRRP